MTCFRDKLLPASVGIVLLIANFSVFRPAGATRCTDQGVFRKRLKRICFGSQSIWCIIFIARSYDSLSCLPRWCIVSKRLNLPSNVFHRLVAPSF